MRLRVAFLILLAVIILGSRIVQSYLLLAAKDNTPAINADIQNGHPFVRAVTRKNLSGKETPAYRAGIRAGDVILAAYNEHGDGRVLKNQEDLNYVLKNLSAHEPRIMVISRNVDGKNQELRLIVPPVDPNASPLHLRLVAFALNLGVPFMAILTGLFIGFMKPQDDNAFVAGVLFLGFSSLFGYSTVTLPPVLGKIVEVTNLSLNNTLAFLFFLFFSRFPSPSLLERKAPWLKWIFFFFIIAAWIGDLILFQAQYSSFERYSRIKDRFSLMQSVLNASGLAMMAAGLISLALNTLKADSVGERRRMTILLTGTLLGTLPILSFVLYRQISNSNTPPVWLIVVVICTMAIFPLSFIYVVLKHRVLGIRLIIRRGLQYAFVSRGYVLIEGTVVFLLLYFLSKLIFNRIYPHASAMSVALYSVILTVLSISVLERLNRPIMQAIDRRFFREAYKSQQILSDLSRAVRQLAAHPEKLLETVVEQIADSLHPDRVAVFVRPSMTPSLFANATPERQREEKPSATTDYECFKYVDSTNGRASAAVEKWRLPEEAFVSRHLQTIESEETEPVEVYLDDPKSWTNALARVSDVTESRYQERQVLEELNTKLILPLVTSNRLLGFLSLGEKLSEEPYSKEDKELLLAVAQQTAIALDYAELIQQVTEQEKLKREIEIAKQVQAQLFPQTLPKMRTLDYTGVCKAARGVGGDYYDFLLITADKLGIALGDISGKGISAALLMASLQALLRSHAPARMDQVSALIGDINRLMESSAAPGKYATFFYALYDDVQRTLTYVNAGHLPPMLFRLAGGHIYRLQCGGMVIGMFPDVQYRQETIKIEEGDILVSFTDGVTEAMNAQEEEFGEERLCRLISENRDLSAEKLRELIEEKTFEFAAGMPQHDDFTLVIAKGI